MNSTPNSFLDQLKTYPQYLIPQHVLSRLVFKLTHWPGGAVTQWTIQRFIKHYGIDMSLAQPAEVREYATFNQFFTRALHPTARPLAPAGIICPVDGEISQIGKIEADQLLQAKGHWFSLDELLGGYADLATLFTGGLFCTLYLSPKDYHRIHIPLTGRLTDMVYVPGKLFSVNQTTTRVVPKLFARNERVINIFETDAGAMAVILVGALFVGSMETVWAGMLTPVDSKKIVRWQYSPPETPVLARGAEMGRFNMGSTVIVLFSADRVAWLPNLMVSNKLLMGQGLGKITG
jgi:phosphatidylserine decarboxylase